MRLDRTDLDFCADLIDLLIAQAAELYVLKPEENTNLAATASELRGPIENISGRALVIAYRTLGTYITKKDLYHLTDDQLMLLFQIYDKLHKDSRDKD